MDKPVQTRIEAIDVLRGLALALMLLVNNPSSWTAVYGPFLHADWHGLTPTDLVFPFFLFVVGASMACSLRGQILTPGLPWLSICKRVFLLIFIANNTFWSSSRHLANNGCTATYRLMLFVSRNYDSSNKRTLVIVN
jgi:predicted acyltransferase